MQTNNQGVFGQTMAQILKNELSPQLGRSYRARTTSGAEYLVDVKKQAVVKLNQDGSLAWAQTYTRYPEARVGEPIFVDTKEMRASSTPVQTIQYY